MSLLDTLLDFDAALEWHDDEDDLLLSDPSGSRCTGPWPSADPVG